MVRYDAIQPKNNKDNKEAFNMMRYCTIEGYAYDVTNDVIRSDVIRVQNTKKRNTVTVLRLK